VLARFGGSARIVIILHEVRPFMGLSGVGGWNLRRRYLFPLTRVAPSIGHLLKVHREPIAARDHDHLRRDRAVLGEQLQRRLGVGQLEHELGNRPRSEPEKVLDAAA
jgi:hypothetical protein